MWIYVIESQASTARLYGVRYDKLNYTTLVYQRYMRKSCLCGDVVNSEVVMASEDTSVEKARLTRAPWMGAAQLGRQVPLSSINGRFLSSAWQLTSNRSICDSVTLGRRQHYDLPVNITVSPLRSVGLFTYVRLSDFTQNRRCHTIHYLITHQYATSSSSHPVDSAYFRTVQAQSMVENKLRRCMLLEVICGRFRSTEESDRSEHR